MGKRIPSRWLTLMTACFGLLMLYIDLFIVNVALPAIGHDFRVPLGMASWTISGYVLNSVELMLVFGIPYGFRYDTVLVERGQKPFGFKGRECN